jgi:dimethylglycine dehydrogenase
MAEMPKIFGALMEAGDADGIALFGTYAMNSLRMEKAYRAWGAELTNEVTMIAADMERFVAFDKDFVGKAATLRAKQEGPAIKLVYLAVDAIDNDCYGNEPVYRGDKLIGITTGGAYGHAVGQSLTFAYVEPELAQADGIEVLMMGRRCPARILPRPAWDAENLRPRA